MSELRDYILSKLQEMTSKAPRSPEGQKAVADWKMKRRVGREGGPVRVGQSDTGMDASVAVEKKAGKLTGKLKSRGPRGLGQTSGGMRGWSNIQQGHSPDARQDASTDLRTQLAYVLADKLEELSQETMDSAAIKRTDMLRGGHRGREVPIYRGGTGKTDKPEIIGTRTTAGTGVIQGRLQGRKATPDKPAKRSLYAGKITPGVTGKEGRAKFFAARAARREDSSTNLKDRMVDILFEEFTGVSRDRMASVGAKAGKGWATEGPLLKRSKTAKALASVVRGQPKVIQAKARKDAADDAQRKANMERGGGNILRSRDSANHPRNNWPSGSWGSA